MGKVGNENQLFLVEKLTFFNAVLILMFLLKSAGYFQPYYTITVQTIILTALILSIFLFNAGSKTFFLLFLTFWSFSGVFKVFRIDVWAERTAIYAFQSLFLGFMMYLIEQVELLKHLPDLVNKRIFKSG